MNLVNIITEPYSYFAILCISISGLLVADWRYKLIFFSNTKAAFKTFGVLLVFFLCWDIAGIGLNIFHTNPQFVIGVTLGNPDLPIEELLFLALLIYTPLILSQLFSISKRRHV